MRRNYNSTIPIAQIQNDKYRVREHALNFGMAYFLILFFSSSATMFMMRSHYYQYALILSGAIAVCVYAYCLMDFTNEARDLLCTQAQQVQEIVTKEVIKEQGDKEYQKTLLPTPDGKHFVGIDVYLTETQITQVANAAVSGKITVNYLDSIGVSRPRAEKLRNELARIGYATFNRNSQLVITKSGLQSFKSLLK